MPERSPARLPSGCLRRSVLPPRKKNLPVKSFAPGLAWRKRAMVVKAVFLLEATISQETGMYLVAPEVVPDERA